MPPGTPGAGAERTAGLPTPPGGAPGTAARAACASLFRGLARGVALRRGNERGSQDYLGGGLARGFGNATHARPPRLGIDLQTEPKPC
jgi:hypothetical protein